MIKAYVIQRDKLIKNLHGKFGKGSRIGRADRANSYKTWSHRDQAKNRLDQRQDFF